VSDTHARIYAVVKRIPRGRVATYGQIAEIAGFPRQPRLVGYALSALTDDRVPWHRVVNARGRVSTRTERDWETIQRTLLEDENVTFDASGRVVLDRFRWRPRRRYATRS